MEAEDSAWPCTQPVVNVRKPDDDGEEKTDNVCIINSSICRSVKYPM